jgi:hypothetical protein
MSQREVEKAINEMNDKMAARDDDDDDVPGNVLKLRGEEGLRIITQLLNIIYEIGEWPKNFTEVTAIALKKKSKATKYRDHRTISLIAHTTKMAARKYVEYFNYLCIMRTTSVSRSREIKCMTATAKAAVIKKPFFFS